MNEGRYYEQLEGGLLSKSDGYCQGADEKTRVSENTGNVLFYGYGIPGVEAGFLKDELTIVAETMTEFGNGTIL